MIELNRQKAIEKKRKREQEELEQIAQKRRLTEEIANRAICDEGLDEPMDLDEEDMNDLQDYMM